MEASVTHTEYHKIVTVWDRDPDNKFKTLLEGQWATPEFKFLRNCNWIGTEKVDGTNIRVIWDGNTVTFGGKTDRAQIPANLLNALNAMFTASRLSDDLKGPCVLYGEGYGAKIQKGGGNYRPDQSFVLFDVRAGDVWLDRETVNEIALELDIEVVPELYRGMLDDLIEPVATGFPSSWGDFQAEGLVMRPEVELVNRLGHRIIAKVKCKDFGG
jgi:hypothetical protein